MGELKILVATDFSESAQNAVNYAGELANSLNARLLILHVYTVTMVAPSIPVIVYDQEHEKIRHSAEVNVGQLTEQVRKAEPALEFEVMLREGIAFEEILAVQKEQDIDLLVVGSKGTSGLETLIFGSVTGKVLEEAGCPVIVVPLNAHFQELKHILYASSMVENDKGILLDLSAFAKAFSAEITVFHLSEDVKEAKLLQRFEEEVRTLMNYPALKFEDRFGKNVIESLDEYLKFHQVDLLVMSRRKRFFYEKILNNSLSRKMAYHTYIPLLIFHF